MEFPNHHIERHQQVAILQEDLPVRYAELQMQNEALYKEMLDYKTRANYWEAQFNKFKSREETLQAEIEELNAKLRKRERQLYGRKSEQSTHHRDQLNQSKQSSNQKKKGQQPGSKGHGKRDYSHLPTVEEVVGLYEKDAICPCCQKPYEELSGTEDSEVLEVINVKPYRRAIRRKKYKRHCQCEKNLDPQIITPPPSERLIPKCKLGISIWAYLLLKKFEYQQPLHRTLGELNSNGLSLAKGTITEGFQKLLPLFIPVYNAIVEYSVGASHWHADETGWKVFETIPGKKNHRWFLWIFHNTESVIYKIEKTRSSNVLMNHFGANHEGGVLNVDRYSAYKVIAKSGLFILAFCWAHVRRDFLNYSKEYPNNEAFGLLWVEKINHLYHINNQRLQHEIGSREFARHDQALKEAIAAMQKAIEQTLTEDNILPSEKKLLISLNKHWNGLTVFVDHPEIPMDNNTAERGLRGSVVGRKNYYGSGSVWSAELAAALFTLFGTLKLWKLNIHTWLLGYFYECALLGGKPPDNIQKYLPWNMSEKKKQLFSEPPRHENPGLNE
jgi:transposase